MHKIFVHYVDKKLRISLRWKFGAQLRESQKPNETAENWSSLVSIVMDSLTPPSKNLNIVQTVKIKIQ